MSLFRIKIKNKLLVLENEAKYFQKSAMEVLNIDLFVTSYPS